VSERFFCPDLVKQMFSVVNEKKILVFKSSAEVSKQYCENFACAMESSKEFKKGCMHYNGNFPCARALGESEIDKIIEETIEKIKEEFPNADVEIVDSTKWNGASE